MSIPEEFRCCAVSGKTYKSAGYPFEKLSTLRGSFLSCRNREGSAKEMVQIHAFRSELLSPDEDVLKTRSRIRVRVDWGSRIYTRADTSFEAYFRKRVLATRALVATGTSNRSSNRGSQKSGLKLLMSFLGPGDASEFSFKYGDQ
jgi:hypothetical protein